MKNEIIRVGQIGIHFLLESADTNGSVAMFEFTVPVGAKMPLPHSHKHYDETIYGALFIAQKPAARIAAESLPSSSSGAHPRITTPMATSTTATVKGAVAPSGGASAAASA